MTDVPEGPADVQPERGAGRRTSRVGDSGSPVGSTLSIVLAVVAVVAGFLILRAITDDDGDAEDIVPSTTLGAGGTSVPSSGPNATSGVTTAVPTTVNKAAATVVVANASGVSGSAAAMSTALEGAGYVMGTPGNTTGEQLDATVVYYVAGDPIAQGVGSSVAADLGGVATAEMPSPPPIDAGLGTATVLVMVGTDTAGKTLADLTAGAVAPPSVAGGTTTTAAGG